MLILNDHLEIPEEFYAIIPSAEEMHDKHVAIQRKKMDAQIRKELKDSVAWRIDEAMEKQEYTCILFHLSDATLEIIKKRGYGCATYEDRSHRVWWDDPRDAIKIPDVFSGIIPSAREAYAKTKKLEEDKRNAEIKEQLKYVKEEIDRAHEENVCECSIFAVRKEVVEILKAKGYECFPDSNYRHLEMMKVRWNDPNSDD